MTDMIKTFSGNAVKDASSADAVLSGCMAAFHRSIGVSAKEIMYGTCMVILSVISQY